MQAFPGPDQPFLGSTVPRQRHRRHSVRLERHGVTGLVTSTLPRSDYWRTMMVADAE